MSINQIPDSTKKLQALLKSHRINQGLHRFLLKVYQTMGIGLLLSGLSAYLTFISPLFNIITIKNSDGYEYSTLGEIITFLFPLFILIMMMTSNLILKRIFFWWLCISVGISTSLLFIIFGLTDIIKFFLITAGTFIVFSLYGYNMDRKLTSHSLFLSIGVCGLIIVVIVNLCMQSDVSSYIISALTILLLVGCTAYNTQEIKQTYSKKDTPYKQNIKILDSAAMLYLSFLNIFLKLLSSFRKNH